MKEPGRSPGASSKSSSEAPVVFTIYCHIHRESGRRYVGQTKKTWRQRWNQHVLDAKRAVSNRSRFVNAIRAYGKDAFDHEVLETCGTVEEANAAEEKWIAHFRSNEPATGFNFKRGGDRRPHPIRNPWNRPEYREANLPKLKAILDDPEVRRRHAESCRDMEKRPGRKAQKSATSSGLWKDDEFREKVSAKNRESHARPEVREKNASSHRGKKLSASHKAKLAASRLGKSLRPETRAKISSSLIGRTFSSEHRANISASQRGRVLSPETRAKIGEAARRASERRRASRE